MKISLNGWQRLWVVASVILLVFTLLVIGVVWPQRELSVLEDLNSSKCEVWRKVPEGFFPEKYPAWNEECYSLQSFLYYQRVNLKSTTDYDNFVTWSKIKTVTVGLLFWFASIIITYLLGWSIGWIRKGFAKSRTNI